MQMHSVEKYHLLTIIDYLLAVLFTLKLTEVINM